MNLEIPLLKIILKILIVGYFVFYLGGVYAKESELYFERKPCIFFCEKTAEGDVNLFINKNKGEYSHYYKTFNSKQDYYDYCSGNVAFCKNNAVIFDTITKKVHSTYEYESVPLSRAISKFKNIPGVFDKLRFSYKPITEDLIEMERFYRSISANYKAIQVNDTIFSTSKRIIYNDIMREDLLAMGKAYLISNSNTKKLKISEGFVQWGNNNIDYNLSFGTSILISEDSSSWVSKNGRNYGFVNAYENCLISTKNKNELFRWIGLRLIQDYELYNVINGPTCVQDYLKIKEDNFIYLSTQIENNSFSQNTSFLDNLFSDPYAYYKTAYSVIDIYKAVEEKYSMSDLIKIIFKDKDISKYIVRSEGTSINPSELNNSPYRPNEKDKLNELIFSTSDIFRFTKAQSIEDYRIYNDNTTIYIVRNESIQYLDDIKKIDDIKMDKIEFIRNNKIIDILKYSDDSIVLIKESALNTYSIPAKVHLYKDLWGMFLFEVPNFLGKDKYILFLRKDSLKEKDSMNKDELLKIASPIQYKSTVFKNIVKIDKNSYLGFFVNTKAEISMANTMLGMKILNDKNYLIKDIDNNLFFIQKLLSDNSENRIIPDIYSNEVILSGSGNSQSGSLISILNIQQEILGNKLPFDTFIISLISKGFVIRNSTTEPIFFICKELQCAVINYSDRNVLEIINVLKPVSEMSEFEINNIYGNVSLELKPKNEESYLSKIKNLLTFDNIIKTIILVGSLAILIILLNITPTVLFKKVMEFIIYTKGGFSRKGSDNIKPIILDDPLSMINDLKEIDGNALIIEPNNISLTIVEIDKELSIINQKIHDIKTEQGLMLQVIQEGFLRQEEIIRIKLSEEANRLNNMLIDDKKGNDDKVFETYKVKLLKLEKEKLELENKRFVLHEGK